MDSGRRRVGPDSGLRMLGEVAGRCLNCNANRLHVAPFCWRSPVGDAVAGGVSVTTEIVTD